jgi:APA family basic amino acid/polyamine antiporter
LPGDTWIRLLIWTAIGYAIYAVYGYHHSRLRNGNGGVPAKTESVKP